MNLTKRNMKIIEEFTKHCIKELGIKEDVNLILLQKKQNGVPSAGSYDIVTDTIRVAVKNRAIADCLRTIAHELTHKKQRQDGNDFPENDKNLQPFEDEANVMSGRLVRFWGRNHREIYEDLF